MESPCHKERKKKQSNKAHIASYHMHAEIPMSQSPHNNNAVIALFVTYYHSILFFITAFWCYADLISLEE
jgi:hypothetical protein